MHICFLPVRKRHPEFLIPFVRVSRVASPACRNGWDIDSLVVTTSQGRATPWEKEHPFSQTVLPLLSWLVQSPARVMQSHMETQGTAIPAHFPFVTASGCGLRMLLVVAHLAHSPILPQMSLGPREGLLFSSVLARTR